MMFQCSREYSVVQLLALHVPDCDELVETFPPFSDSQSHRCAMTGHRLTKGVALSNIVKPATAAISDTFKFSTPWVLPEVAACFKAQRELRGNLYVTETALQRPMLSLESARKAKRPCWLDIFQAVEGTTYHEEQHLFIITDESKRRLWPAAAVTTGMAPRFRGFVKLEDMACLVTLSADDFYASLRLVTWLLTQGFTRPAIRETLLKNRDIYLACEKAGAAEMHLARLHQSQVFQVAWRLARDLREVPETDKLWEFIAGYPAALESGLCE